MKNLICLSFLMFFVALSAKAQYSTTSNDTIVVESENLFTQIVFFDDGVEIFTYKKVGLENQTRYSSDPQLWLEKIWRVTDFEGKQKLSELARHRGLKIPTSTPVSEPKVFNL